MTALTVIRSQEEITQRINEVKTEDWLGTELINLVIHLPFEQAEQWLITSITRAEFEEAAADEKDVQHTAIRYLDFAIGKAVNHRGISAGRSVSHFRAWLWLLLPDDEFAKFEDAEYAQYGAPKIKAAAQLLGAEIAWDAAVQEHPELARMAEGDPCTPGCDVGCGA